MFEWADEKMGGQCRVESLAKLVGHGDVEAYRCVVRSNKK